MPTNRSIWSSMRLLLLGSVALGLLSGCGGGQGGGGSAAPTTTTTTTTALPVAVAGCTSTDTVREVELLVSSPSLPSSGASTIDVTARVFGAAGVLSNKAVTFAISDPLAPTGKAFLDTTGGCTDATGRVTTKLNLGTNKVNRPLTLTATADGVSNTPAVTITVTGTTVTVAGNPSVTFGTSTPLTVTVKDSAGVAVPNATVTVTSANGNTLAPTTGTTNALGQFVTTVTGTVAAPALDTISATALGVTQTFSLTVSSTTFAFTAPANNAEIPVSPPPPAAAVPTTLTVHWDVAGVPVAGTLVTFFTTRGSLCAPPPCVPPLPVPPGAVPAPVTSLAAATNGAGDVSVNIVSTSTGNTTVTASGPGSTPANSLTVTFVATSATRVDVQAIPATVPINVGTSTTSKSTISAVVRDAADNLAKNATVSFAIAEDRTGGRLSAPFAITDDSGIATVSYIAGTTSCCGPAPTSIRVTATVTQIDPDGAGGAAPVAVAGVTNSVSLTVGGQPLFVILGSTSAVSTPTPVTYRKTYVALVTDAGGNAVPGAPVTFTVRPPQPPLTAFRKGVRVFCVNNNNPPPVPPAVAPVNDPRCPAQVNFTGWIPAGAVGGAPTACVNEDVNFNGILDPGEDTNGNGRLEPRNVSSVNSPGITNATGFATVDIDYPRDYAQWADVTLTATAVVGGTEATASTTLTLPVAAADVDDAGEAPPGAVSPFGSVALCTSPL